METTDIKRRNLLKLITVTAGSVMGWPTVANAVSPTYETTKPVYIAPGEGEKYKIPSGEATFKLSGNQTLGNLGSAEMTLMPGFIAAPPHFHKNFDEICIVQEGTLHVMVGEEVVAIPTGGWHLRPRGLVHTFWNSGNVPAKFIELYTPGGFEAYLKGLDKLFENGSHPKPDTIEELSKKFDIVLRFDLLRGIMDKYKVHL